VPNKDYILVLPDRDKDGLADRKIVFARGLKKVHGLAFHKGVLYAAGTGKLYRLRDKNGDLRADKVEVISEDIPGSGGHWTRTVVAGPDNKLYVSAGSSCNVCIEKDKRRAAVLRFPLKGGKGEIFAKGLRNSVGLAFHPDTGQLWASNNGRDWLGDNLPPEEINLLVKGGDYGWPYCYGKRVVDPDFGTAERCRETLEPEVEMQAHSAPLGISFGHGLDFPARYKDMLFVAFHGSWNRTEPTGYKLVGIPFKDGEPAGQPEDIVTGWMTQGKAWGRPVAPLVGSDGALYISDDKAGAVYRISYGPASQ
jgi:glucose/arabinose dehydrogenase